MLSTEQTPQGEKHVVIVGGGFAGLNCARKVAANPNVRVTLLDKNNYHQFQPLLYQAATGILSPDNIAFNLRFTLLHHPNVDVKMANVVSIDPHLRVVETADGQRYQGDFLVLAAGSQPNFFNTPGAQEHSYPLYSLHDAERLRSRILAMLESAERDPSLVAMGALNIVIVGCGPTGAEMAGALGDMLRLALKQKASDRPFKDLPPEQAQIFLVDGGHAVLSAFSPASREYAAKMLEERGVQLLLGTRVKEIGSGHVLLSDDTDDSDAHCYLGRGPQGCILVRQSWNAHGARRPRGCCGRPHRAGAYRRLCPGGLCQYHRQRRLTLAPVGLCRGTIRQMLRQKYSAGN